MWTGAAGCYARRFLDRVALRDLRTSATLHKLRIETLAFFMLSFLLSFSPRECARGPSTTAAQSPAASGPRPTSSTPAMRVYRAPVARSRIEKSGFMGAQNLKGRHCCKEKKGEMPELSPPPLPVPHHVPAHEFNCQPPPPVQGVPVVAAGNGRQILNAGAICCAT